MAERDSERSEEFAHDGKAVYYSAYASRKFSTLWPEWP
jgi:hypothetical protein